MSETTGYNKNWYKEWFGEDYLTVYEHRDQDDALKLIDLIFREVPIKIQSKILDVACGNGRHAYLLGDQSYKVFGVDLSAHLLEEAKNRQTAGISPSFAQADMRYLPFHPQYFDVIFSLFTSFGYFEKDRTNQSVAMELSRVLKKDGYFVMDYLNPDYVVANLNPYGNRRAGDLEIEEERWVDEKRVYKKITINKNAGHKVFYESVRLYSAKEMTEILGTAGIRIEKLFGEYDGSVYHPGSSRMIIFGKKD